MITRDRTNVAVLEQRLAEAQATIDALLSGQVDAIVDPETKTPLLLARAQASLRESETRYRFERDRAQRYLDTASVMLVALDTAGRITLINRHACDLLGWTEEELIGRSWIECCVPERRLPGVQARFEAVVNGDLPITETPIRTRGGEERLIEWRNNVVRDSQGNVTGIFSSGTDITKRAAALSSLRATEERTQFALEAAKIGTWNMDYVTGKLQWSEILQAQYGMAPGSFDGSFESFVGRIHPEDREAVVASIEAATKAGKNFTATHRSLAPDGTIRWLRGAGYIYLDAQGEPLRGVGISQDVTELRAMETQFLQAQKMEAVGRLASGVAHDFNNLLSVILGWSMMSLDDLPAGHPVREGLDEVIKAANGAAGLTKQLLAFSRQQLVEPVFFNPNELVVEADRMLRRVIGEDIELVTRVAPDTGTVKMDRGQLEQVIMNLIVNARDAMPTGGRITVETANVTLNNDYARRSGDVPAGEYVMLSVTDSGTGMSDEVKARIFEPFFTTKDRDKGTGLGLSTVYGVVKQAGGLVEVYSELGVGTAMKVYLPRRYSTESRRSAPVLAALFGTETILLVEDEDAVRRVTTRMLQAQGYRVIATAKGEEAMQILIGNVEPIHLLLTDVVLARGMSGRVLAEQAVALFPKLPVLYASGYTNDVTILHGMLDAGVMLVQKPFTAESLGRRVREVLDAR
jgi:two-component system cell cycle sensor histidine kinase/response regulator CckA